MPFSFIHAADIHLDSPLRGLEAYEGAPVKAIRSATRRAFVNLIDLAIDRQVDFVLLAGDIYNGESRDYNTGLFFSRQMQRLREADIRVVMARGNHDAMTQVTRTVTLPKEVHELPPGKPTSVAFEDLGVVVHGQSFDKRDCSQNLAANYPAATPGAFNIGLLHTSVGGHEDHETYAPCTLDDLIARDYQYWALGHVHEAATLCKEPWIAFPGNLQGRHIRETGPRGCLLVDVDNGRVRARPQDVDVFRWYRVAADAEDCEDLDALIERAMDEIEALDEPRESAVRLTLQGAGDVHQALCRDWERAVAELRNAALQRFGGRIWIEKIERQTRGRLDLSEAMAGDDAVGSLLRHVRDALSDDSATAQIDRVLDPVAARLRRDKHLREAYEQLAAELPTVEALRRDVLQTLGDALLAEDPS
jgi:DNA repair exonuclease SbcCD nuclease subunit